MSIDVWDTPWSELERERPRKIKVYVKSSQSSVCKLGTCLHSPTEKEEDIL